MIIFKDFKRNIRKVFELQTVFNAFMSFYLTYCDTHLLIVLPYDYLRVFLTSLILFLWSKNDFKFS